MTKGVRSTTCIHCSGGWDEKKGEVISNRALMTLWNPPPGYDPMVREFKCSNCGKMTYQRVSKLRVPGEPDD